MRFRLVLCVCTLLTGLIPRIWAGPLPPTSLFPAPTLPHRVVLLRVHAAGSAVETGPIADYVRRSRQAQQRQGRRGRRAFRLRLPTVEPAAPAPASHTLMTAPPTRSAKPTPTLDAVPPEQRVGLAETLFVDALAARLHDRRGIETPDASDVRQARRDLHLTETALTAAQTDQLVTALHGEAAWTVRATHVTITEEATPEGNPQRVVRAWFVVVAPVGTETRVITAGGAAASSRSLLRRTYAQSEANGLRQACHQAADVALQEIVSGQTAPLSRPDERLAVAPLQWPALAAELEFTPTGRHTHLIALSNVGHSASIPLAFVPNLLPLEPSQIVRPQGAQERGNRAALRHGDQADSSALLAYGRRLGADWVLAARITQLDLDAGGSEPNGDITGVETAAANVITRANGKVIGKGRRTLPGPMRGAKVEAAGLLVRVADGSVWWRAESRADWTESLPAGLSPAQGRARVASQAVRYALRDLSRQFARYRARFTK